MLQNLLNRLGKNKERFKELEQENKIASMLEKRQKSPQERDLERFKEEERQRMIKAELEFYKKQDQRKFFQSNFFNHQQTQPKGLMDTQHVGFLHRSMFI